MKISYHWLNDYLPTGFSAEETARLLTDCGLETEGIETAESVPGGLRGLFIGEVKEKAKHPNADKLSLTKVDVGGPELLSIVCGAPNVEAGQKVVVAVVGTIVHPTSGEPFEIKKSKIRGELSEGMICAEDEIGLGKSHDGILVLPADAQVGMRAAEYFKLESDQVLEIGLTPNRADAASHFGVARDLSAVMLAQTLRNDPTAEHQAAKLPQMFAFSDDLNPSSVSVELQNPEACIRYSGVMISGIEVKPSPAWLQRRLSAIGVRPINNVVDVTNYVLHELGQPLHAFDADKIAGKKVIVRKVDEGTPFVTLDGVERKLAAQDLMICDTEKPMCIAGVFGGLHSGVSENTKAIFLESACFEPVHVRKTSKRHTLKTDSSFRFERGTDPNLTMVALQRAAWLLNEVANGEVSSAPIDIYPTPVEATEIAFSYSYCDALIGKAIERSLIRKILLALGIEIVHESNDALLLAVPPFKVDVKREADVVEEVLRIYGYNNIGFPEQVRGSLSYAPTPDAERAQTTIANLLAAQGFQEMVNNSLTKAAYYEGLNLVENTSAVELLNPLSSDLSVLRQTLLFGGLEVITYNQNRRQLDLRLYEFGKVYRKKNDVPENIWPYEEERRLMVLMTGRKQPESWNTSNDALGFFDLKNTVHQILQRVGISEGVKSENINDAFIVEGLLYKNGKRELVRFGKATKALLKKTDTNAVVWIAEFNWDTVMHLLAKSKGVHFSEVPKFPAVRRDLALVLDRQISYQELEQLAYQTERKLLRHVNLFDVYEGDKIGKEKKSYALSFTLQDENATLTDKEIEKVMERLAKAYTEKMGAQIRS